MQIAESTRALSGFAAYRGRLAAVRRQRDYRSFWIGSSLQGLGQGTQFMVIGWLVLLVTDSSTQLGLVIFLYGAPNVALLLVAGLLADRIDRRYILMATQVIVGGVIAALAFTWWPSGTSMPLPSSWAWYSR